MNLPAWKELVRWLSEALVYPLISIRAYELTLSDLMTVGLILLGARLLVRVARRLLYRRLAQGEEQPTGKVFALAQFAKYAINMLAVLFALRAVGIDITLLIAGSTALFVGVGLGLQQTFNDFASGVILLFEGHLQVDDVIKIENYVGRVTKVGLRTSRVRTREGFMVTIPNSKLVTSSVINLSHQQSASRFSFEVRLAYGSDLERAKELLVAEAARHPEVLPNPAPFVWLLDFAESGVLLGVFIWTEDSFLVDRTLSDLRFAAEAKLRAEGFHIPYATQELYVRSALEVKRGEG